jgi:hypothetical protein
MNEPDRNLFITSGRPFSGIIGLPDEEFETRTELGERVNNLT